MAMSQCHTVFLSLGSNLGDRHAALSRACERLDASGVRIQARSSIYETEPVGVKEQPWFLNLVLQATTKLSPSELLTLCLHVESEAGRSREVPHGARPLDIDVLLYDSRVSEDPALTLPHPRMRERRFVLVPLLELVPTLSDPRTGERYVDILDRLDEGKQVIRSIRKES
jgi:2-amino-4-hydroxy-6-hydroxymethyldihydropteridine diphosphokinase